MRVYGPYKRKDGRQHVILINDDGSRRTVSYPKYLMEQHLGRELDPDLETVDHIDRDFTNNDLSNLRVIPRSEHAKQDAKRVKSLVLECLECGATCKQRPKNYAHNRRMGKAGPFCSRQCSGRYGARLRAGGLKYEVDSEQHQREYFYGDKN